MSTDAHTPTASTSSAPSRSKGKSKASAAASSSTPPLGKFLASSEKHVRDKAVASLSRFLSAGRISKPAPGKKGQEAEQEHKEDEELPVGDLNWDEETEVDARLAPAEMAKLWKGIFFCFWMSDKPLVQQALADDLANLTLDVRPKSKTRNGRVERFRAALCYLKGFWEAVTREWAGLDRLRLDKFYLLVRRFVHVAMRLLQREGWDERAIAEYNAVLTGPAGPLHVTDVKIPHSLAYHLSDIFVDEIERLASSTLSASADSAFPAERSFPLNSLLAPFRSTLAICPTTTMFSRITTEVFTPLLDAMLPAPVQPPSKRRKGAPAPKRPEYPGILALAVEAEGAGEGDEAAGEEIGKQVLKRLFEEGGKAETSDVNRRRIYAFVSERDVDLD
ncbi:hypothetical protein JCM8097_002735 [Rhodosporidiobolus ruineniae]